MARPIPRRPLPPRPSPMRLALGLLALVAFGHLAFFVFVVNVVHALGLNEVRMSRVKVLLLAILLTVSGVVVYGCAHAPSTEWPWPLKVYALLCIAITLVGLPVT